MVVNPLGSLWAPKGGAHDLGPGRLDPQDELGIIHAPAKKVLTILVNTIISMILLPLLIILITTISQIENIILFNKITP